MSYIETLKNNCRSTGFTDTAKLRLLDEAHKLYKAGFQKHHEEHFTSAALSSEYHYYKICQNAAMELSKTSGPEMVAAALLAPVDRQSIKELDHSLYSVITAFDKMMSFHVPTKADESIIKNHYRMLIADPLLTRNYSGEELLSAHFLMAGIMLSTLEKGIPSIQLFYRDPIILSQMALSTADLLSRLNKNYQANRLKDAALSVIRPDQYELFANMGYRDAKKIALLKKKDAMMIEIRRFCEDILKEQEGVSFKIEGRLKSVWSIMNKHKKYAKSNKREALDILGFRIILHCPKGPSHIHSYEKEYQDAKLEDRNSILKLYHENIGQVINLRDFFRMYAAEKNWGLLEADDYLFNPKKNGYQSLQDTFNLPLEGEKDSSFEIQFVTDQMYECNSTGAASNRSYKSLMEKGLSRFFKPDELTEMYEDIQTELAHNVYAYAYKMNGINSGNAMEIYGPFEMLPEPGAVAMPLDVLSNINVFDSRHFKKYDYPGARTEMQISIDEKVENGDLIRGEGVTAFGAKRFEFIGTNKGKSLARFHVDSKAMAEGDIAYTKKTGKDFLNELLSGQKKALDNKLDVIFLQKPFLEDLGYENLDMAHFYIGKSEYLRDNLKKDISRYILGCKYDPEINKITYKGHRDSLLTRQIMEFLGKGKYNMRSVNKFLEGERSIFEAELDNFSESDFRALTESLKENGSIRKFYKEMPANNIRDKKLEVTFSKDEPGIIYKVYNFLIGNNCYVSSFKSDETVIKSEERGWKLKLSADDVENFDGEALRAKQKTEIKRLSAEFDIKFPGKYNDDKYIRLLDALKNLPGAYIKTANLSVTKDVSFTKKKKE